MTTVVSEPVTVDTTPPIKSDLPIYIKGRHITSTTELEAWYIFIFRDLLVNLSLSEIFYWNKTPTNNA